MPCPLGLVTTSCLWPFCPYLVPVHLSPQAVEAEREEYTRRVADQEKQQFQTPTKPPAQGDGQVTSSTGSGAQGPDLGQGGQAAGTPVRGGVASASTTPLPQQRQQASHLTPLARRAMEDGPVGNAWATPPGGVGYAAGASRGGPAAGTEAVGKGAGEGELRRRIGELERQCADVEARLAESEAKAEKLAAGRVRLLSEVRATVPLSLAAYRPRTRECADIGQAAFLSRLNGRLLQGHSTEAHSRLGPCYSLRSVLLPACEGHAAPSLLSLCEGYQTVCIDTLRHTVLST